MITRFIQRCLSAPDNPDTAQNYRLQKVGEIKNSS